MPEDVTQGWSLSGTRPLDHITIRNPDEALFVRGTNQVVTISYVALGFILRRGKGGKIKVDCPDEQTACDTLNGWGVEIRRSRTTFI